LGNQRVITGPDWSGHLKEDVEGEYKQRVRVPIQFYGTREKIYASCRMPVVKSDGSITINGVTHYIYLSDAESYNSGNGPTNGNVSTNEIVFENENNNNGTVPSGRSFKTGGAAKKSKKEKKVKGTRKLSGYMKFAQEARPKILAEDPSLKSDIIAVGKKIGAMWRGLSDSEKAKY
jgi:hypothetical protein